MGVPVFVTDKQVVADVETLKILLLVLDPHTLENLVLDAHLVGITLDKVALGVSVDSLEVDTVGEADFDELELSVDIHVAEPL